MKITRLAALVVGLALGTALPALAQTFGVDKRIHPHTVASISQNPAIYAQGNNVYLAWSTFSSASGRSDILVSVSSNNGDTFSTPVIVSSATTNIVNIQPVIAGDGTNVHVFWTDDVSGEAPTGANANLGRIFISRSSNNGASFTAASVLVSAAGYSRPTSALVNGTEVHLVFYDNRTVPGASTAGRVYHIMSCNSGAAYGVESQVTQFDGDVDNENPRLNKLSNGEIFLTFRSSRAGIPNAGHPPFQVYLLRMATGCPSATWFYPAQRLSPGTNVDLGGNYAPHIFPGINGGLHAAWWNDSAGTNLIYRYGQPNGMGFGPQQDLSGFGLNHLQWTGLAEHGGFGMGEDATGRVHAMFQQNSSLRGNFQTGSLWHRCSPSAGGTFVSKRLVNGLVTEPHAVQGNSRMHMVWMDFRNTAINQSEIYYNFVTTNACAEPAPSTAPVPATGTVSFGGNSIQTTGNTTLQLTNPGGGTISVSGVTATTGFSVIGHNCASLPAGGACSITIGFTPTTTGTTNGTLTITYSSGGPAQTITVNLTGTGELSLVKHYYRSILNRAPEPGGQEFWEGERTRLVNLGANVNEIWFVMANYFFNSPEYIASGKTNTAFMIDVYNTFFNRPPDQGGFDFWMSQMDAGLSREGVIFWFMFSNEFRTFTQGIFGSTAARPEVDMVMDFFRGILNRFPDTAAFNAFVGGLRSAQCQAPAQRAGAVYTAVNDMSYFFMFGSPEYANRARNNTQFVSDLYNAFLRRGGAASEVAFWINQLNIGGKDRNTERVDFISSGEFSARVNAVVNAGCLT